MHFDAIWSCNFKEHEYMISNTLYMSRDTWVNLKLYAEHFQGKLYDILVNSELSEFKVFIELKLM